MLRGLTREHRHWGSFPARFTELTGEPVTSMDPPGFGVEHDRQSPSTISEIADDFRVRFEATRGDDEWSIMGISLGGMVTLDWVSRFPDDFARAVVINSSAADAGRLTERCSVGGFMAIAGLALRRQLDSPEKLERAVLGLGSNRPAADLDEIGKCWADWRRQYPPSRASVLAQIRAGTRFRLPESVSTPLLVLTSAKDRLVSHHVSARIAKRYCAPLRTNPTAGHDIPLDDPDWIIEQVQHWTKS